MNNRTPSNISDVHRGVIDAQERLFLEALSRQYRGALTAFFRRRAPRWRHDSEDMTQEVFMRLARREGAAGIERAEQYLFQVARSVLADSARRQEVRKVGFHETYEEIKHGVEDFSPQRVLESREQVDRVLSALNDLPENVRAAFVLHRFEELTYGEIAQRFGVSVSSVEKYIIRALKAMTARAREGE